MAKHPKVANQFGDFIASHNKNYKDVATLKQKLITFKENMEHVDNHDETSSGFKIGINMFSDMTEDEFIEQYGNKVMEKENEKSIHHKRGGQKHGRYDSVG